MSKQPPKQRTLEFFLSKPKQSQSSSTQPAKSTPSAASDKSQLAASGSKDGKSGVSNTQSASNANVKEVSSTSSERWRTQLNSSTSVHNSKERSTSPVTPYGFSSSRSVASDARSVASNASRETPPTSEIMDPMEEDEEEDFQPVNEEEDLPAKKGSNITKKALSTSTSEKAKENVKATSRPTKRRKTSDYDDDFVVPDDEEEDEPFLVDLDASDEDIGTSRLTKGKKASKSTESLDFIDDDDDDVVPSKGKGKSKGRPSISHAASSSASTGGLGILTAAEQRMQAQKQEKSEAEKPYDFLQEVKDVGPSLLFCLSTDLNHTMQKDGKRPGEEGYDPRTLYIPKGAWGKFTPFEVQFWEIKQNHYDTKGKFYELYEDDARIGHQIFDLKLTSRVKMSMVGVPEMSFDFWANKFLARGYKVGKVEQAETSIGAEMRTAADSKGKTAKADKLVKRVLNKVFTNGTLMDGEYLNDEEAGHCVSLREQGDNKFGLAILDSSTSEFKLSSFEDDPCRTKLETLLRQLRPKEVIISKGNLSISTNRLLKNILPGTCTWTSLRSVEGYDYQTTLKELGNLYPAEGDIDNEDAIAALPEAIQYLRTLNIDSALLSAKNFDIYDPMRKGQGLVLMNSDGSDDGTLLKLIGRCVTPFGEYVQGTNKYSTDSSKENVSIFTYASRLASQTWYRLDAVEEIMAHDTFSADFFNLVKGVPDLERIVSRIHAGTCKVKDFLKVLDVRHSLQSTACSNPPQSFKKINNGLAELADTASTFETSSIAGLLRSTEDLKPYLKKVKKMFKPPPEDSFEMVPEPGINEDYDAVAEEMREIEGELEERLKKLSKTTGATGLKDIYMVQVNASDKKKVPKDWQKHNETKAKSRYNVPELGTLIRKLKEARENEKTAIKAFTAQLFAAFDEDRDVWLRAIRVTAELDCLIGLAKASSAIGTPSCRPQFVESDEAFVEFTELRHPSIAMTLGAKESKDFIANDVALGSAKPRIMLLTGPNMAGKSTLMRQTCVGVIMAQMGMYVPASSAKLSPVDAILTRMGAYDNMFSNSSTFKVELDECCKIIREATPKSLVILDELGRGTSTFDGIAIASAVLHHLSTHTLALSCFATHYSSLTNDYDYHPNIRTMHMATAFDDDRRELIWLYKLVEGVAPSSFGTHVASLAGVPEDVVKRADVVSNDFARQFAARLAGRTVGRVPVSAQADLAYLAKLVQGTLKLDDNQVRKRETLKILKTAATRYGTMA
ncbi:14803_t:CDS:10 [Acaulospora colombiana]|uniref:14803_t:CDS:1 n=1 Tax=Acaulospora colombiana TaxID=27376 RepID=A0ACA9LFN7_9GLOM|nr:14803_t:CDS:10 [Acaulospora colombiana]